MFFAVATNAGHAAEDPGADENAERGLLTRHRFDFKPSPSPYTPGQRCPIPYHEVSLNPPKLLG